jgi:single-stranded-DNA-specific exonuclease
VKPAPRRWEISGPSPLEGFPPVLAEVLAARGHDAAAAQALLDPSAQLHDPHLLIGMDRAVATLREAMDAGTTIAIFGDFDSDGVTGCALLTLGLRAGGATVIPYIPHRTREGYGLNSAALEELFAQGVGCVVTVDCGTTSVEAAAGRPAGMKLVITDHHLAAGITGDQLAPADALINPRQPGCTYPFDGLAGAAVGWKLICAMEAAGALPAGTGDSLIGLAALGTVADMMPLTGENRTIVGRGLLQLAEAPPMGLRALVEVAKLSRNLTCADLAFGIAPRINAAGRMEHAKLALKLCLADDEATAMQLAIELNQQNIDRQKAVAAAMALAETLVADLDDDLPAIVLRDDAWHMGIVGLVAGRIAERYARPTFIATKVGDELKGSARSVRGVHLVQALDAAAAHLTRYGGHAVAAGFSAQEHVWDDLQQTLRAAVAEQLGDAVRERVFAVETTVTLGTLTPDLCRVLAQMEPCGMGNPQPLLCVHDCEVLQSSTFGADRNHLKVVLRDATGQAEAIAFFKPGLTAHLPRGRRIDACFNIDLDSWNGQERVRLRLKDIRPATVPATPVKAEAPPEEPLLVLAGS